MMSEIDSQDQNDQIENELPEKYRGKSVEDVAKMHMEAERDRSRIANELGAARQIADQLLGLERARPDTPRKERQPVTTDELLTNPDDVLERAVADSPTVSKALERVDRLERDLTQREFELNYPNYKKDIEDPAFAEWIKANKVRTALGTAANSGNYEAATSLWSLWEEKKQDMKQVKEADKTKKRQQEKDGILEGASSRGGDIEKEYSRADFMMLHRKAIAGDPVSKAKWNDPNFQRLREKAYAEGRVK